MSRTYIRASFPLLQFECTDRFDIIVFFLVISSYSGRTSLLQGHVGRRKSGFHPRFSNAGPEMIGIERDWWNLSD